MHKEKLVSWVPVIGLGLSCCALLLITGCGGGTSTRQPAVRATGLDSIQHIVFIIKENRSFDNYFGTFPVADGATKGTISNGHLITLGHTPDKTPRDPCHDWGCAIKAMDGGKMDDFDLIRNCNVNGD